MSECLYEHSCDDCAGCVVAGHNPKTVFGSFFVGSWVDCPADDDHIGDYASVWVVEFYFVAVDVYRFSQFVLRFLGMVALSRRGGLGRPRLVVR